MICASVESYVIHLPLAARGGTELACQDAVARTSGIVVMEATSVERQVKWSANFLKETPRVKEEYRSKHLLYLIASTVSAAQQLLSMLVSAHVVVASLRDVCHRAFGLLPMAANWGQIHRILMADLGVNRGICRWRLLQRPPIAAEVFGCFIILLMLQLTHSLSVETSRGLSL